MKTWKPPVLLGVLALLGSSCAAAAVGDPSFQAQARHEATITGIPAGTKKVRIWLALPREDAAQKIEDLQLTGPGEHRIAEGGTYGNRFGYFEVTHPGPTLTVSGEFRITRKRVGPFINLLAAQPLTDRERLQFARELAPNRYVPVDEKYRKLAREIVGEERNPVLQARKLYEWVLDYVEYWVKDPQRLKASANGESEYCLVSRTGNCTDFHSLFASLARSLGIPTRMDYGSLFQGENLPIPNKASLDGKDTDASYHCWVQVYAHGIGWIPLDVALADLLPNAADRDWYFGHLDARRVTWSYGRDLTLSPPQEAGPVNAMHKVYVEVDGKPYTTWTRKLTYRTTAPQ